ncbi:pirin family protein [Shewanella sp. 1CM18E]|uniref:pirin family protein n=1 Tax=Shewanella sp. 1CM18E TaxID=2929169 RepID=UPI0020BE1E90|nr:pirin family protein [Shewanella sp. 1CM18E]MCK8044589.1 pirin family protein [Shewanella sp. 1CM18E]
MEVLNRDSIPLGGFAGLTEHRLITDTRIFGDRKSPHTVEGLGNFVFLADAIYNPFGETHMHSHHEIDVISVMMSGRVKHQGSLEHGQDLVAGEVQVQRAGGEGFSHNEINPDDSKNRLLQLWVLPDETGQAAGYKHYVLKPRGITRIYGGDKAQTATFDSKTVIDIARLGKGESLEFQQQSLIYVTAGQVNVSDGEESYQAKDGDLIRTEQVSLVANTQAEFIVVRLNA